MIEDVLKSLRGVGDSFARAIIKSVTVDTALKTATVHIVTDRAFTGEDEKKAKEALRAFVPAYFDCRADIVKLTPDKDMVRKKIAEILDAQYKAVSATMGPGDILVERNGSVFDFTIHIIPAFTTGDEIAAGVCAALRKNFCGEFTGRCVTSRSIDDLEVKKDVFEPEYIIPIRSFPIRNFSFIDSTEPVTTAVYIEDVKNAAGTFSICGVIADLQERSFINKRNIERKYYQYTISDTTDIISVTFFPRQKVMDRVMTLKPGDSIVCTGKPEEFGGLLRFKADHVDIGYIPENFRPVARASRPVPMAYHVVEPQPFTDYEQHDFFTDHSVPACLKENTFVVLDIETTGLNAVPVDGHMDTILEIGAYKVVNGEICESFATFCNPGKPISEEIVKLTGITDEMVKDSPSLSQVIPDFYRFCSGSILVGHNIVNFDYKFIDYYCTQEGFALQRRLIDTMFLARELLPGLNNYKLNTIADEFGIRFNHHRAIDDSLTTAKIFLQLIKKRKSLPALL